MSQFKTNKKTKKRFPSKRSDWFWEDPKEPSLKRKGWFWGTEGNDKEEKKKFFNGVLEESPRVDEEIVREKPKKGQGLGAGIEPRDDWSED